MDIKKLIRSELAAMGGYTPIEPIEVLEQQAGRRIIKLDGNENPYGCSPKVYQSLASYPYYHIYPDPEQRELRQALEEYTGLSREHIVCGSGSDELIDLILRLFLKPGDKVINCSPTFGMYPFSTEICGGEVIDVPRDEEFAIDIAGIKKTLNEKTKVIFVASPNNPTGNAITEREIVELVDTGRIVVVDEAYFEFSFVAESDRNLPEGQKRIGICQRQKKEGKRNYISSVCPKGKNNSIKFAPSAQNFVAKPQTMANLVPNYSNLVVLRTFSKWAGLAGLRIGYGFFPTEVASYLMKIKPPYNINVAAQAAVLASLADIDYLRDNVAKIVAERERLFGKLTVIASEAKQSHWLKPYPSSANFILCSILEGNAKEIWRQLQKKGIFVRYFDTPRLKDCLRMSVGKPEDTDALIEALRTLPVIASKAKQSHSQSIPSPSRGED